jgi:hypothetical protein
MHVVSEEPPQPNEPLKAPTSLAIYLHAGSKTPDFVTQDSKYLEAVLSMYGDYPNQLVPANELGMVLKGTSVAHELAAEEEPSMVRFVLT